MNIYTAMALAFIAGSGTSVQAIINSQLRIILGHPILGAIVNFSVGLVALLLTWLLLRIPAPSNEAMNSVSPWLLLGGVMGAFFVASMAYCVTPLGATLAFGLVIAGQIIGSALIDHFGLFGTPVASLSVGRLSGIAFLLLGVWLVKRG